MDLDAKALTGVPELMNLS
ncbi:unnamed protein product, partial [Didymodactylos carnosus]